MIYVVDSVVNTKDYKTFFNAQDAVKVRPESLNESMRQFDCICVSHPNKKTKCIPRGFN